MGHMQGRWGKRRFVGKMKGFIGAGMCCRLENLLGYKKDPGGVITSNFLLRSYGYHFGIEFQSAVCL